VRPTRVEVQSKKRKSECSLLLSRTSHAVQKHVDSTAMTTGERHLREENTKDKDQLRAPLQSPSCLERAKRQQKKEVQKDRAQNGSRRQENFKRSAKKKKVSGHRRGIPAVTRKVFVGKRQPEPWKKKLKKAKSTCVDGKRTIPGGLQGNSQSGTHSREEQKDKEPYRPMMTSNCAS